MKTIPWYLRPSDRAMLALVFLAGCLLYLPCAGSYGLWDPWETHYGEVARQMTVRGDFISLWWPGSPRETEVFQTKPVLAFWLMSLGLHVARAGLQGGAPDELALGTAAEWALRVPFCLMGALGLVAVYLVTARLGGRRAGLLAALVTATCPLYALVARQAMTDMAFVGPTSLALALAVLALHEEGSAPLPRRRLGPLSCPDDGLFRGAVALLLLLVLPQLLVDAVALRVQVPWGGRLVTMYGAVVMIPYLVGLVVYLLLAARISTRAPLYLLLAAPLAGLAVLGKGLAGLGLPVIVFVTYAALSGRLGALGRRPLRGGILLGLLACALVALPWHHAMFIRHGMPWWNELFGDNHWRRLMLGRHGDRGSFEYFLRELAYGTLPWGALVPAALAAAGFGDAPEPRRSALRLGAIWFVCSYALVSSSITKFHHYALPAVPGLGLVVGLYLDAQLGAEDGRARRAAAAVGLPLLALVAANALHAVNAPQIFLWLFSYDYIPHPKGRPWPAGLEVRPAIALPIALAAAALALAGWRRGRRLGLAGFGVAAIVLTLVLLDGFLPSAARHWSQKETIAAYFRARRSADERLLAYFLFWRGETFYTKNAIHEGPPGERTVFDGDDAAAVDARLAAWLAARAGQRHFLLYEPAREARLRALLPPGAAARFEVVEQPNPKFRLARVDL